MTNFRLLINGRLVKGAGTLDVITPATGRILAKAPRADRAQLEEAAAAAKAAFPTWSATPLRVRAALLVRLAQALEAERGEFARLVTEEQGMPVPEALGEIDRSIAALRYFATFDLTREVHREDATQKVVRQQRPLGAVAGITPWNVPVILLLVKVAPALLAGNTVVAKPAPTAPLTTLRFGEFCARILPPGVVNVIVDPNDLGTTLSHHPNMARVAFIGNHGVSLSFYFADPEGHLVEVYRPAGGVCRPLHAHSIDLTRSEEALRQGVAELAVQAGAEG